MKILVINAGSSSIKYKLIEYSEQEHLELATGNVDKIGEDKGKFKDHHLAMEFILNSLVEGENPVVTTLDEIDIVGHRVVHGGESFHKSTLIDSSVIQKIKDCSDLAPLHNPANLEGIHACMSLLKDIPQVAVFDTAFHQTIPEKAYMYPLPYEYYRKYKIRKYGFHGTSHRYVFLKACEELGLSNKEANVITCHLGNGCSIAAIEKGKCIDTSMGLTPLEGLMMGTRSGDLDPAALLYIMQKENIDVHEMDEVLNKKSGLLGVTEKSNDLRDIRKLVEEKDEQAMLALDMFIYRILKYIGAYIAILGKVDAIVFTAGIGEHSPWLAEEISSHVYQFLDKENTAVLLIPTDEEIMIASEAFNVVRKSHV